MYKRISYAVAKGDGSACGMKATEAMNEHIKQHLRSSGIPQGIKATDVEKYVSVSVSMDQKEDDGIFHTVTFSLCGAIPRIDGQNYSHNSFQALVKSESGKIKDKLPAVCDSTKTCIALFNPNIASKNNLPSAVTLSMKAGFPILDYKFVIECIKEKHLLDMDKLKVDLSRCSLKVIRQPSLENKLFRRTHVMTSIIKKRSMKRRRKPKLLRAKECNPAFHFVWSKIKELKVSRKEARLLMPQYFQQWKMMSRNHSNLYRRHCENLRCTVGTHVNFRVKNPAYELGMVDGKTPQNPPFVVQEEILLHNVEYQLTGAVVLRPGHFISVATFGAYIKMRNIPNHEHPCRLSQKEISHFRVFTGQTVKASCKVYVDVCYGNYEGKLKLYEMDCTEYYLLGREWLAVIPLDWKSLISQRPKAEKVLNVSELEQVINKHAELFEKGLSRLTDAKIILREEAQPVVRKPVKVTYALKEKVEVELVRLENCGVITPVSHSEWDSSIVAVEK
ncbi:hypothetical protein HOLleu_43261 [Holothuria leucospilota]|uniref:BRCT domain-containing protein n=1 Tax=Holothuria leucospilota TaxID=206669 RepID=A0A9Q1BB71_HOLLE|nr:hypothetical protein HOLleu_43261 [Holothuria leucospilota]